MAASFPLEALDRVAQAFVTQGMVHGEAWDEFGGTFLSLPKIYNTALDPLSEAYAAQQDQLWQMVSGHGGTYVPELHEQAPEVAQIDPLARPGLYQLDMHSAGDHLIALGHLVKLSGIAAGERVLEYGAGFGQIALTLARLGAKVDTVDINLDFCNAVTAQAAWFKVPLTAHTGQFGENPRPGEKYKLIIFYECFHHAREFVKLIEQLHAMLADDGRLLLAGEPIVGRGAPEVPYPWGMRLDAEACAVVRLRGWYEIGFQEDFLLGCFVRGGFTVRKHPGMISPLATTYEFRKRPQVVYLSNPALLPADAVTWHEVEPGGRWTTARSTYHLDNIPGWTSLSIRACNFHPRRQFVTFSCGYDSVKVIFEPGDQQTVSLERRSADQVEITADPISPLSYGYADDRGLGIFIESFAFL